MQERVAVVTGASRGIGRAVAVELAGRGAHVIAVARTQGGLEELDDEIRTRGGSATLVPMDVTDYPAIDRLGAAIFERWKKLDILVGNAGVLGRLAPLPHIDPKVWDQAFAVNVTANFRLIRALEPLLRQSDAGRAVFLTSGRATKLYAYWGTYAVTKAALDAMVRTWAAELATTTVRVNLYSPGPVRTRMRAEAMPGEDPSGLTRPEDVAPRIADLCEASVNINGETIRHEP
jgi:NAD(P)-dependent dehydrogenase (short-subunit alcohol dehydrogenase family)